MAKKLIGFALRPNLKYPVQYYIYGIIRELESFFIDIFLEYSDSLMFTPLMFIGEFFAGLIVFLYQKKFVNKSLLKDQKQNKQNILLNKIMKKAEKRIRIIDNIPKMIFLLFCCAYFDFIQFIISFYYDKFLKTSISLYLRLMGLSLIIDSLFYFYMLKLPIVRHQVFCLIIIGAFSLIMIITEFLFQEINIYLSYANFLVVFLSSFIKIFFNPMIGLIEKYLFEFNNMNPFNALLFEGFFGFLFSLIYDVFNNPFKEIKEFKKNKTSSEFTILIFGLIIYTILSCLKNLYRVNTTKIFTPMTTTAIDYLLNPIILIFSFIFNKDFITEHERNYTYFFFNFIIVLIISFFSLAFNEFIILYFCGLDKDTHLQITNRSENDEEFINLKEIDNEDDDEEA